MKDKPNLSTNAEAFAKYNLNTKGGDHILKSGKEYRVKGIDDQGTIHLLGRGGESITEDYNDFKEALAAGVVQITQHKSRGREKGIILQKEGVIIGKSYVEYGINNSSLIPKKDEFPFFTIDRSTFKILKKIATCLELGEPCLIEGETSASKTSSVRYIGYLAKRSIRRINLDGQTDVSDLIGRFAPNDGRLEKDFIELLKNPEVLTDKSKKILNQAKAEDRCLTLAESQMISASEGITTAQWKWTNGALPNAMINGEILLCDEINLAEAQVLERMNSVLEDIPTLTITENNGFRIGPQGDAQTHPQFAIIATMNPVEYSGRKPLSPAFKNRWSGYIYANEATAEDLSNMMRYAILGQSPKLQEGEVVYSFEKGVSQFPKLAKYPDIVAFIEKMTGYHIAISRMAQSGKIGKGNTEKYIFTRRDLIQVMKYYEKKKRINRASELERSTEESNKQLLQEAITHVYLDKMKTEEDRTTLMTNMDTTGLRGRL